MVMAVNPLLTFIMVENMLITINRHIMVFYMLKQSGKGRGKLWEILNQENSPLAMFNVFL